MTSEPPIEIIGLADVETAGCILQDVNLVRHEEKNGSSGRIRRFLPLYLAGFKQLTPQ